MAFLSRLRMQHISQTCYLSSMHLYRPQEGNIFRSVCHSVHSDYLVPVPSGCLCPWSHVSSGRSLSRGISIRGVSVQEGFVQGVLCPGGSLSRGFLSRGSLSRGSLSRGSLSRGSLSRGFLARGSLPPSSVDSQAVRILLVCCLIFCYLRPHLWAKLSTKRKINKSKKHPLHKQLWNETNARNSLKSCSLPTLGAFKGIREIILLSISGGMTHSRTLLTRKYG